MIFFLSSVDEKIFKLVIIFSGPFTVKHLIKLFVKEAMDRDVYLNDPN